MPEPLSFERLAELFESARDLDRSARAAYLDEHCGDDEALRGRVLALLSHHDEAGVLDQPVTPALVAQDESGVATLPERIGGYRILERIGAGGMGTVYKAEQEKPRRTVALKVMRVGLHGDELMRRFAFEAEVLGRLQHDGIARIYEAGTATIQGVTRPFFAMEFIDGLNLAEYVERTKPNLEQRLKLFAFICDAVQHAHQKGVIHRDLKPANVLMTAEGLPKVVDFGVARATDADVQATLVTAAGQLVGTLAYMSPEQVMAASDQLDTRSDVYALGVILFELLAERLPYDIQQATIAQAARIICESAPTALTTIHRGFRGDLNTVVSKALRKEPDRRYQSASDLAADIRRILNHEPISARPATAMYHLGRFARRHRGLVATMIVAVVIALGGAAAITWQATQISAEADTRAAIADLIKEMLSSVDPAKTAGEPLTVRMMLDDVAPLIQSEFDGAPLVRADLHQTVGVTYHRLGAYDPAAFHLGEAVLIFEEELGPSHEDALNAVAALGYTLVSLGKLEEAEQLLTDGLARAEDPDSRAGSTLLHNLAIVVDELGRTDDAIVLFERVVDQCMRLFGADHQETAGAKMNLGSLCMNVGDIDRAVVLLTESYDVLRAVEGEDHPGTISASANLGVACAMSGRMEEATSHFLDSYERSVRVLGEEHRDTLRRAQNVIIYKIQSGSVDEAVEMVNRLADASRRVMGVTHFETLEVVELQVAIFGQMRTIEEAERIAMEWYERVSEAEGASSAAAGRMAFLVSEVYDTWKRPEDVAAWRARVESTAFELPPHLRQDAEEPPSDG